MVGLSVVLEEQKWNNDAHRSSNILNKATILKISMGMIVKSNNVPVLPTPGANILDFCSLCKKKLLPGKDIYMYKGDGAFCTVECRSKQIMMDEEETRLARMRDRKSRCSFAAIKNTRISATASSSSSSKPRHHHLYHHHQGPGAQDRSFTYRYYPTITPYMRKY